MTLNAVNRMRNREPLLFGLDIGTTKVCALAAETTREDTLHVIGFGQAPSAGIRKGVVVNIEKTVEAIRQAVRECELMSGASIKEVYAGIAGNHIYGTNEHGMVAVNNNRTVTEEDVRRVIASAQAIKIPEDRAVLHILPRDFIVDDQDGMQNPLGMSGVRLEVDVHIVTCSATSGQNIVKCCNHAGLDVAGIVLEPLASAEAVLSRDERELGVVLVDIGGGTTDIAVYASGSIVHTSVLALGGNHLTNDIAIGLSTPLVDAERLKHEQGIAQCGMVRSTETIQVPSVGGRRTRNLEKSMIAEIIEARMREVFDLVDAEIDRSGYRHVIASGVVLTGGSSLLPGIDDLAAEVMHFPVRVGFPEGVTGLTEMVHSPMHATGMGLLRYAMNGGETHYHPEYSVERSLFGRVSRRVRDWAREWF